MGHGPDEAALGVHLRVAWRTLVLAEVADDQILVALARLLEAESPGGIFVTVCDATIDRDLGLTIRVAGHPPPLLCLEGAASYVDVAFGPPLGIRDEQPAPDWPVTPHPAEAGFRSAPLHRRAAGRLPAGRQPDQRRARRAARDRDGRAGRRGLARRPARDHRGASTSPGRRRHGARGAADRRCVPRSLGSDRAGLEPAPPVNRAIVGVLLLLMVLVATVVYFINDAKRTGDELVEQWDPAYTISQNTLTAMVNQETGVRGYALGQDEAFLEPYNIAELLGELRAGHAAQVPARPPRPAGRAARARRRHRRLANDCRGADHRPGPGRRRLRGGGRRVGGGQGGLRPGPCGVEPAHQQHRRDAERRSPRTASEPSPTSGSRSPSARRSCSSPA